MPCNNKSWELLLHIHCLLIWVRMCSGEKWEEKGFTWDCLPLFRHSAWTETPAQTHKGRSCFVLCLAHHKCWAVRVALAMLVLLPLQPPLPQPYCRCTWPWKGHGRTSREWFALSCLGGCSDILRFSEDPRYNLYCRCCVCVPEGYHSYSTVCNTSIIFIKRNLTLWWLSKPTPGSSEKHWLKFPTCWVPSLTFPLT